MVAELQAEHAVRGAAGYCRPAALATGEGRPLGPAPATGKRVSIDGLIMDRVVGGKVQERWEQFDQLLMLSSLGLPDLDPRFDRFASWVEAQDDAFGARFAKSLREWSTTKAGWPK